MSSAPVSPWRNKIRGELDESSGRTRRIRRRAKLLSEGATSRPQRPLPKRGLSRAPIPIAGWQCSRASVTRSGQQNYLSEERLRRQVAMRRRDRTCNPGRLGRPCRLVGAPPIAVLAPGNVTCFVRFVGFVLRAHEAAFDRQLAAMTNADHAPGTGQIFRQPARRSCRRFRLSSAAISLGGSSPCSSINASYRAVSASIRLAVPRSRFQLGIDPAKAAQLIVIDAWRNDEPSASASSFSITSRSRIAGSVR